jgi:hypothetical protein
MSEPMPFDAELDLRLVESDLAVLLHEYARQRGGLDADPDGYVRRVQGIAEELARRHGDPIAVEAMRRFLALVEAGEQGAA